MLHCHSCLHSRRGSGISSPAEIWSHGEAGIALHQLMPPANNDFPRRPRSFVYLCSLATITVPSNRTNIFLSDFHTNAVKPFPTFATFHLQRPGGSSACTTPCPVTITYLRACASQANCVRPHYPRGLALEEPLAQWNHPCTPHICSLYVLPDTPCTYHCGGGGMSFSKCTICSPHLLSLSF